MTDWADTPLATRDELLEYLRAKHVRDVARVAAQKRSSELSKSEEAKRFFTIEANYAQAQSEAVEAAIHCLEVMAERLRIVIDCTGFASHIMPEPEVSSYIAEQSAIFAPFRIYPVKVP